MVDTNADIKLLRYNQQETETIQLMGHLSHFHMCSNRGYAGRADI